MLATCAAPGRAQGRDTVQETHPKPPLRPRAYTCARFAGGTQVITTAQLSMAWALFARGDISMRCLRIYFAAFEMATRRRFGEADRPHYQIEELKELVGGRGSKAADQALRADVKRLARVGLVAIGSHAITFATSADRLTDLEDRRAAEAMLQSLDHRERQVPVPRRMIRALAAGFGKAQTAVILAKLIRGCFYHRGRSAYRIDSRTKAAWIAERFGISQSAAEKARVHLIDIGWLRELPTHQRLLNLHGTHDLIVADWSPATESASATLTRDFRSASATPKKQEALPYREDSRNRELRAPAPERSGFSHENKSGSRKERAGGRRRRQLEKPNLRDIQREDLEQTRSLTALHEQAIAAGLAKPGEHGELEFFALAERVRTRATTNPGGMFWRLLADQKWAFVTQSDEDAARLRQKAHRHGARRPSGGGGGDQQGPPPLSLEERRIQALLSVAGNASPETLRQLARKHLGYTAEQWDAAYLAFRTRHCGQREALPRPIGAFVSSPEEPGA